MLQVQELLSIIMHLRPPYLTLAVAHLTRLAYEQLQDALKSL